MCRDLRLHGPYPPLPQLLLVILHRIVFVGCPVGYPSVNLECSALFGQKQAIDLKSPVSYPAAFADL